MAWDYRVMKRTAGDEVWYEIHEVYYDNSGRPVACTEQPSKPFGENITELAADLQYFTEALEKPPLDYDTLAGVPEKGL